VDCLIPPHGIKKKIFRRDIPPPTSWQQNLLMRWLLPTRLHDVITQKVRTRIFTFVKTYNLTYLNMNAPDLHNKRQSNEISKRFQEANSRPFSTNIVHRIKRRINCTGWPSLKLWTSEEPAAGYSKPSFLTGSFQKCKLAVFWTSLQLYWAFLIPFVFITEFTGK
jgi:hypothetical protein